MGLLPLLLAAALLAPQDPERREPAASSAPHTVFAWSSRGGLRYTWVLPPGYDGQRPRHLTVILHGTGLDYRWGHWNNKPGIFRPDDVVVSVDGTAPGQGDSRLFLGEKRDAQAFRDFLAELRETFAVDRIFLYGHSQGGFFVVYYAGEAPETVAGVVAHASGAWDWSQMPKALERLERPGRPLLAEPSLVWRLPQALRAPAPAAARSLHPLAERGAGHRDPGLVPGYDRPDARGGPRLRAAHAAPETG
jgi:pimeloyl-ACP methyl ester carboxylesterase